MIKTVTSNCPEIVVVGGSPAGPYISTGAMSAGQLRYNPNTQNTEVYDGVNWQNINTGYVDIRLSPETQDLLNWLRKHRLEVEQDEAVRKDHPAVKKAWEQYQVVKTLAKKEKENV